MPTIIPGYVYSLFAALIVGVILVCCCNSAAMTIRGDADRQQLQNVADYVAAESLTLISQGTRCQNATQALEVPSAVGNQRFWIRIESDAQTSWVEAGFGTEAWSSIVRSDIPASVSASGTYLSGEGHATLVYTIDDQTTSLTLTME